MLRVEKHNNRVLLINLNTFSFLASSMPSCQDHKVEIQQYIKSNGFKTQCSTV